MTNNFDEINELLKRITEQNKEIQRLYDDLLGAGMVANNELTEREEVKVSEKLGNPMAERYLLGAMMISKEIAAKEIEPWLFTTDARLRAVASAICMVKDAEKHVDVLSVSDALTGSYFKGELKVLFEDFTPRAFVASLAGELPNVDVVELGEVCYDIVCATYEAAENYRVKTMP